MPYSIGEAAKAVGISKSTLSRAIKNGRISAIRLDDGSYSIEPVELHRVYKPVPCATGFATGAKPKNDALRNPLENAFATVALEAHLEAAREQLKDRENTIADLRHRLDQSETERREAQARVVGLLSDQHPNGFWARLMGRK